MGSEELVYQPNGQTVLTKIPLEIDVNSRDVQDCTPLHRAAASGSVALVRELLERGAESNAQDQFGWTPLHVAADKGYAQIVSLLIDNNAAVYRPDTSGFVACDHARANDHGEVVRILESTPVGHGKNQTPVD